MSEPAFKQRSINILNVLIVTDSEGEDYCELNYSTFCQPVERTLFGDELVVIGGSGIFYLYLRQVIVYLGCLSGTVSVATTVLFRKVATKSTTP